MAATVSASLFRTSPMQRPGQSSRRCGPCFKPRAPFCFVRPCRAPPRAAFYRSGGFGSSDEAAMKSMLEELARQWRQHKGACGGSIRWPGGSSTWGGASSCKPRHHHRQQQQDTTAADDSSSASASSPQLQLDVTSTEDAYLLFADIPGLSKADLTIRLSKERLLTISGSRPAPAAEGLLQRERPTGPFERQWQLPQDADSAGISAMVAASQLTVSIPRKPEVDDSEEIFIA